MYKLYAFFDVNQLDESLIEHYMLFLPQERRAKVLRYRKLSDRQNCVAAYLLLIHALHENYNICVPGIAYSDTGKPYLPDYPNVHFNISHCPKGCICAISDSSIGVDIQDIRPFSYAVAKHCCSQGELRLLAQSAYPAAEFTKIWAMKESYLKMAGVGIGQSLSDIETTKLHNKIKTFISNGCYIAVASAELFREELTCLI